jgi:D-xylose transport system ATP-binding protein
VADRIACLYLGRMAAVVDCKSSSREQVVELITTGRSGSLGTTDAVDDLNGGQPA